MNLRISQGQAIRSILGRWRVTHRGLAGRALIAVRGYVAEFLTFLAHDNDAASHQLRDHCVETCVRSGLAGGNAIAVCGHVLRHTNVQDHGTFWRADQAHQLFGRYFGEAGFGVVSHQGILSERSVGCEPLA